MRLAGPVLIFRGLRDNAWMLAALVVVAAGDDPPVLSTASGRVSPVRLAERRGHVLWRYNFALEIGARRGRYSLGGRSWDVGLPVAGGALRAAFTACNGSERGNAWSRPEKRNRLWIALKDRHAEAPFHLLIQGGDQLYADPIWRDVPELAAWRRKPWRERLRAPFTPAMREAVRGYYFEQYCWVWGQKQLAAVLAEIPSLMMWDDHDIIDGWGSYPAHWQECEVLQGIWRAAREHFALFQLGTLPDELPAGFSNSRGSHFGWAYRIGDVGILAPDLRSERTRTQVLGKAGWPAFRAVLDGMASCRRVLLICTVPLVNVEFPLLERLFSWMPGHQTWQDDLVDQWPSLAHREEWGRLVSEIMRFSSSTGVPVTSLSGEIHLGSLGLIESASTRIYQLTSSGIVHPPPDAGTVQLLEWATGRRMRVSSSIIARALKMPGSRRHYLRARNWLELELPDADRLDATWHAEGLSPLKLTI